MREHARCAPVARSNSLQGDGDEALAICGGCGERSRVARFSRAGVDSTRRTLEVASAICSVIRGRERAGDGTGGERPRRRGLCNALGATLAFGDGAGAGAGDGAGAGAGAMTGALAGVLVLGRRWSRRNATCKSPSRVVMARVSRATADTAWSIQRPAGVALCRSWCARRSPNPSLRNLSACQSHAVLHCMIWRPTSEREEDMASQ